MADFQRQGLRQTMTGRSEPREKIPFAGCARAVGAVIVLTGSAVLAGWAFDIVALKSVLPGLVTMKANAALGFILAGISLWLFDPAQAGTASAGPPAQRIGRIAGQVCAACAAAIGLLTLSQYLFGWDLGIDQLLFREAAATGAAFVPGRTSPAVAINFLLVGLGLFFLHRPSGAKTAQLLCAVALAVSLVAVIGYAYGVQALYKIDIHTAMALHTALAFVVLSAGVICSGVSTGFAVVALLASDSAAGLSARLLLPAVVIVPVALGWLRLAGERAGLYGTEFGLALFAVSNVAIFAAFVLLNARLLERRDAERQQAAAALRRSEAMFQQLFESAPDAVIAANGAGVMVRVNRQAEEYFGYRRDELLGRPVEMLLPERFRPPHAGLRAAYIAEPRIRPMGGGRDLYGRRKDGSEFPVDVSLASLETPEGMQVVAVVRDATERRRAERRVHEQLGRLGLLHQITRAIGERQDLQSIFRVTLGDIEKNLPLDFAVICTYDAIDHRLTVDTVSAGSQPLAEALGLTEGSALEIDSNGLGRAIRGELVHEPDTAAVGLPFSTRLAQAGLRTLAIAPLALESKVLGVLIACRREARSLNSVECEFLRQLSEHVTLAAQHAKLHDALQRAYDDLRQTQQAVMQQERLRALGQMASGIAHDINNAISPASLYIESLLAHEPGLSERGREHLTTIARAIDDVAHTVSGMREFYRQREPQLVLLPVQLNRLVHQVVDLTRPRWSDLAQKQGRVVELRTDLAHDLPQVMGIESELREALTNLVLNAVDAMREDGTLTLRTRMMIWGERAGATPTHCVVEVSDTGVGMDEDTRRRCLEPFFTTKGERGTGLGLAMVYGVMERHSADIEIDSEPGKGTTVRLAFSVPRTTIGESKRPAIPAADLPALNLLIVDDDPMLCRSLRDALVSEGHRVSVADTGQGGIDMFRDALERGVPYEVVITDLGMPYVDGRAVARAVKQASPATPVIMLTGWGMRMSENGEVPAHVDRILGKPPKVRELREALYAITRGKGTAG